MSVYLWPLISNILVMPLLYFLDVQYESSQSGALNSPSLPYPPWLQPRPPTLPLPAHCPWPAMMDGLPWPWGRAAGQRLLLSQHTAIYMRQGRAVLAVCMGSAACWPCCLPASNTGLARTRPLGSQEQISCSNQNNVIVALCLFLQVDCTGWM